MNTQTTVTPTAPSAWEIIEDLTSDALCNDITLEYVGGGVDGQRVQIHLYCTEEQALEAMATLMQGVELEAPGSMIFEGSAQFAKEQLEKNVKNFGKYVKASLEAYGYTNPRITTNPRTGQQWGYRSVLAQLV